MQSRHPIQTWIDARASRCACRCVCLFTHTQAPNNSKAVTVWPTKELRHGTVQWHQGSGSIDNAANHLSAAPPQQALLTRPHCANGTTLHHGCRQGSAMVFSICLTSCGSFVMSPNLASRWVVEVATCMALRIAAGREGAFVALQPRYNTCTGSVVFVCCRWSPCLHTGLGSAGGGRHLPSLKFVRVTALTPCPVVCPRCGSRSGSVAAPHPSSDAVSRPNALSFPSPSLLRRVVCAEARPCFTRTALLLPSPAVLPPPKAPVLLLVIRRRRAHP